MPKFYRRYNRRSKRYHKPRGTLMRRTHPSQSRGIIGRSVNKSGLVTFKDGFNAVANVAFKALKMAKGIKGLINVEFKHKDQTGTLSGAIPANPNAALTFIPNTLQKGDDVDQRNGNKVLFKSWHCNFTLTRNSSGSGIQRVRVVVVNYPTNENQGVDFAEYWKDQTSYSSVRNLDYVKQFRTLYSKEFVLDSNMNQSRQVHIAMPLNFHTQYNANNGTYADITSGLLELMIFGEQSSNAPTIGSFNSRIHFIDN